MSELHLEATWPTAEVTMISRSRGGDFKKGARLEHVVRAELQRLGVRLIDDQTVVEVKATEIINRLRRYHSSRHQRYYGAAGGETS